MGCVKLLNGLDLSCFDLINKYYQQIVLVNKADVNDYLITSNDTNNRIAFNLKAGKTGFLYIGNEAGSVFSASFKKTADNRIPLYEHKAQLPVSGVSESVKVILHKLDLADYFAAIQFKDGTVEIIGFTHGLTSEDYEYQPQSAIAGAVLNLVSKYDEYHTPYNYYASGMENTHFNNLFAGIGTIRGGDFNDDYSNDFYIEIAP